MIWWIKKKKKRKIINLQIFCRSTLRNFSCRKFNVLNKFEIKLKNWNCIILEKEFWVKSVEIWPKLIFFFSFENRNQNYRKRKYWRTVIFKSLKSNFWFKRKLVKQKSFIFQLVDFIFIFTFFYFLFTFNVNWTKQKKKIW